jgi:hypothetical protein
VPISHPVTDATFRDGGEWPLLITPNLVFGLVALFAGIWIATTEVKKP